VSVLAAPILHRLYAPDAYGTLAVFASITGIIGVLACLRYELAIVLPESDKDAANLLAVSLCSVLGTSAFTTLLVLFARRMIVRLLNAPDLASYLWLAPLHVLANGAFLAFSCWSSRTRHFGRLGVAAGTRSVVISGIQLGAVGIGWSHAGGLIGGVLLGSVAVMGLLGWQSWPKA